MAANKSPARPARPFRPVIATANDLATGAVVFRTAQGKWSRTAEEAGVAENDQDAAVLLDAGERDVADNKVIDLALIPVLREGGGLRPAELRERIRAGGPTIRLPEQH